MSRRKPVDKTQIRERRNRMLASAAAARLSPSEGVREMRAISGMTQEDFARHRGVSARVVKAIELGQGNPTMATLNRIGQFFGLEVAFVPIRREAQAAESLQPEKDSVASSGDDTDVLPAELLRRAIDIKNKINDRAQAHQEELSELVNSMNEAVDRLISLDLTSTAATPPSTVKQTLSEDTATGGSRIGKRKKPRSS